jgi:hypothetical protein
VVAGDFAHFGAHIDFHSILGDCTLFCCLRYILPLKMVKGIGDVSGNRVCSVFCCLFFMWNVVV